MALSRSCPLCDAATGRPVWRDGSLRYVRCVRCGVVFSDVDRARYVTEQHNVWHEEELGPETIAFYRTARERVHEEFLDRFEPASGRLLDVGCGLGYFVERALTRGWDAYGCDTSAAWVAEARTRVDRQRFALGGPDPSQFTGRFDLVTAWDVLEHVHDPLPFLRALSALTVPGGRVFIRTPNLVWIYPTYGLRRHLFKEHLELGALNHVVYYTSATLRRALRGSGLEPVEWPVLVPPQVGLANRDPSQAGRRSSVTVVKNAHARLADCVARASRGRVVVGADLDVVARSPEAR
jgi:2-polyprenyl-3-methyl-5-hydroxy-6-metoxy-1,4-benzoquinol methylase